MNKKIIAYTIGILVCIIIDAAFVAIAIHHEAPVSDYILKSQEMSAWLSNFLVQ